jgi:outer membrane lipoprotein carrier protein
LRRAENRGRAYRRSNYGCRIDRKTMRPKGLSALFALLLAVIGVATGAAQDAARPAADGVARQVQARYQTIKDFTADFSHTYEGGVLRKRTTERGAVLIKKPGRMRWTYSQPEEKVFVSDGLKIYAYVPADRQVTVSSMPADDKASTPILFLVGKGDLVRDFTVSYAEPVAGVTFPADSYALKLTPRIKVPEYEWLILVVDKSLKLRMLVARDSQSGTSTFTFSNLKENVSLKDSQFTFTIPRGADVITQS